MAPAQDGNTNQGGATTSMLPRDKFKVNRLWDCDVINDGSDVNDTKPEVKSEPASDVINVVNAPSDMSRTQTEWRRGQELRAYLQSSEAVQNKGHCCALAYDESMQEHCGPDMHPERPARIAEMWRQLGESGLTEVCTRVSSRRASKKELMYVHSAKHVDRVLKTTPLCAQQFNMAKQSEQGCGYLKSSSKQSHVDIDEDTYICSATGDAARMAAGCVLSLVDGVMQPKTDTHCGLAVVRPPGHHASKDRAAGFCLFNNVAIAARYLQRAHGLKKILIVDWDVHHGDGTNKIFSDDPNVLFFSLHRYDNRGAFYPGTGLLEDTGKDPAKGYTVNVPLSQGYRDLDVCHVVRHVLFPLAERFQPEFILVSAGFDAVHDDNLGGCHMTPQGFGWMTRSLYSLSKQLCNGRLLLVLEGGYNCVNAGRCAVECVGALVLDAVGETPMSNALPPIPEVSSNSASMVWKSNHAASMKTVSLVRKLSELHHLYPLKLPLAPKRPDGMGKGMSLSKSPKLSPLQKSPQLVPETVHDGAESEGESDQDVEAECEPEEEPEFKQQQTAKRTHRRYVNDWRLWFAAFVVFAIFWRMWDEASSYKNSKDRSAASEERHYSIGQYSWEYHDGEARSSNREKRETTRTPSQGKNGRTGAKLPSSRNGKGDVPQQKDVGASISISKKGGALIKDSIVTVDSKGQLAERGSSYQATKPTRQVVTGSDAKANQNREKARAAKKTVSQESQRTQEKDRKQDAADKKLKAKDTTQKKRETNERGSNKKEKKPNDRDKELARQKAKKSATRGDKASQAHGVGMDGAAPEKKAKKDVSRNKDSSAKLQSKQQGKKKIKTEKALSETRGSASRDGKARRYYIKASPKHRHEVHVYIAIPHSVKSKDITSTITSRHLHLQVKGQVEPLIDGQLSFPVISEESFWEIGSDGGKRCIRVTLRKRNVADQFDMLFTNGRDVEVIHSVP